MITIFFLAITVAYVVSFNGFRTQLAQRSSRISMTATDKPPAKKIPKAEALKINSNYLADPLKEELQNDEIFISPDAYVVMKYHGSYQQDNRENRVKGQEKDYQFMLRLKSPAGEITPELYLKLDELCDIYGQGDLRITTRQAWQIHGVLKGDLKTVINTIMDVGSSTVGACGDVSRNVMCTPAPFKTPAYEHARQYSKVMAELFKPQSTALTQLWKGEEKVADLEYWAKEVEAAGFDINAEMRKDRGTGIVLNDPTEPIYGKQYLPRKFKFGVTVPGDNSIDIYTNDVGLVVITDEKGELEGFNVMVGGGMGRTHMKDTTFARTADHLGFVKKEDVMELCKAIVATQRDHGNRDVRPNARMKYLVHTKGIDAFRTLVEGYFGKSVEPWRDLPEWKYEDWMGWHEQGDGNWFLGVNVEQGRVKDYGDDAAPSLQNVKMRTALYQIVKKFNLTTVLSPTQSIFLRDVKPEQRAAIDAILSLHNVKPIEEVDPLTRKAMACPALPLCGLAITEAERRMPHWIEDTLALMRKVGLQPGRGDGQDDIMMRMTGCPNGCARPYMAELALVGDGPEMYQVWLGGSPGLTSLATTYKNKVKWTDMDTTVEPLLVYWKFNRSEGEAFGSFCSRVGMEELARFSAAYTAMKA